MSDPLSVAGPRPRRNSMLTAMLISWAGRPSAEIRLQYSGVTRRHRLAYRAAEKVAG